jgi:hypothetical protein
MNCSLKSALIGCICSEIYSQEYTIAYLYARAKALLTLPTPGICLRITYVMMCFFDSFSSSLSAWPG